MIVRASFTVAALAALLIAGESVMAGSMPSNEGPGVVLDEQDIERLFTPTITTIIEAELPQYVETSDSDIEAVAPTIESIILSPAFDCPQYGCGNDL